MRTEEKRGRDEEGREEGREGGKRGGTGGREERREGREGREEGREGGKRGGYSQIEIESLKTYIYLPLACPPPSLFLSLSSPARRCVHC